MALAVSLLGGFSTIHPPVAVHAAGCYGGGCNDQDPNAQGCVEDGQPIGDPDYLTDRYGNIYGYVRLYYSSNCGAVWMAFVNESPNRFGVDMTLTTVSQTDGSIVARSKLTYTVQPSQETDTRMLGVGTGTGFSVYGVDHITNYPTIGDGFVDYRF